MEEIFMKNKFIGGILCICALFSVMGCSAEQETMTQSANPAETVALSESKREEPAEEGNHYEKLIAAAKKCVVENNGEVPADYDFSSVIYMKKDGLGYLIEDIDGNGTEELIFGGNGTDPEIVGNSIIYDVYTISNGELVHVLDGWERNRYYLCENGMIANEGSSGAANSNYSYFNFDGSKLHLVESVIFDGIRDTDHPWFYSTESEYDTGNAEPISEEQATEIMRQYVYKNLIFIPFIENN